MKYPVRREVRRGRYHFTVPGINNSNLIFCCLPYIRIWPSELWIYPLFAPIKVQTVSQQVPHFDHTPAVLNWGATMRECYELCEMNYPIWIIRLSWRSFNPSQRFPGYLGVLWQVVQTSILLPILRDLNFRWGNEASPSTKVADSSGDVIWISGVDLAGQSIFVHSDRIQKWDSSNPFQGCVSEAKKRLKIK